MAHVLFWLVHLTWGLPQTIVGAIVALRYCRCEHEWFHGALLTRWTSWRGLSMGPFIFVHGTEGHGSSRAFMARNRQTVVHEFGHCVQSLISGPLYLLLFAIPSMIWAGIPTLERKRSAKRISYYAFYTERLANWFGERVCHEPSPGQRL